MRCADCVALPAAGQTISGSPGAPDATVTIDGLQLPAPGVPFGGKIERNAIESTRFWPPRVVPPADAPNILLIMTDDVGFGAPSTFGGVIPTPALDRIAEMGLRYTNMHSTALCSPTRAALLTGRNHHSAGFGVIAEQATGFPGYDSVITKDKATIATILSDNGYNTSWFGKNHNTPGYQISMAGPFDQWPTGMGFDYFYGFMGGDTSQWTPGNLFRDTTQIYPFETEKGFNLITAMADEAIGYMEQLDTLAPEQPFFVYYAPGGTHAPHHPTPEWIEKISDMHLFDEGWNKLRDTIFANQKRLGVIPETAELTPWPADLLKTWDQLSADEKKLFIRQADVYAAYLAYTDSEIGRVIQAVEDMGKLDDTLIIYISGDNGSSAEGTLIGTPNEVAMFNAVEVPVEVQLKDFYDLWGSEFTYNHMAVPWTWAFDTPFKWTKQIASYFGGTRQGMAIAWPKVITDKGGVRNQFAHVIDIAPTILEVTGIREPSVVDGIAQSPMEGTSLAYTFDAANTDEPSHHRTQYFEMFGNYALYHEGWMLVDKVTRPSWVTGGSAEHRPGHAGLGALRHHHGLDAEHRRGGAEPGQGEGARGGLVAGGREVPGAAARRLGGQPAGGAAAVGHRGTDRRSSSRADDRHLERRRADDPERLLYLHRRGDGARGRRRRHDHHPGRALRGLRLLRQQGQAQLHLEPGGLERITWEAPEPLSAGKHTLEFDFKYDGLGIGTLAFNDFSGIGQPGTGELKVDGAVVATKAMPHTIPLILAWDENMDIGSDTGTPVDDKAYQVPFAFTGRSTS